MHAPTLLVMAAGLGSRYGGLKQIEPLGPNGEIILDYSLYDAWLAGFRRVVFIVKPELETTFEEVIGSRWRDRMEVCYAHQTMTDLAGDYPCPPDRVKPWGTGHAVWSARHLLEGPFGVIGADDYFGRDTMKQLFDFLSGPCTAAHWGMVAFRLGNTLSESGTVARGICQTENGLLTQVTEHTNLAKAGTGALWTDEAGQPHAVAGETPVSMNVWGFDSSLFARMEPDMAEWLKNAGGDPLKREYWLPQFVDREIKAGRVTVEVRDTASRWYGVTYREDRDAVMAAFAAMHADGTYPKLK